jgi:integrase
VLRINIAGKRRHIGLGSLREVTLAEARERAAALKEQVRSGVDPIAERRAQVVRLRLEAAAGRTFDQCAAEYIAAHRHGWKNAKHAAQWGSTLAAYASPKIGALPVHAIERQHVLAVLQPIWKTKTETASRLRSRIELVLSYAMSAGYRPEGPNPAAWRGGLDALLPPPAKVAKVQHHPAVPVREVSAFWRALEPLAGEGARALRFILLTGARSGEVRGARWEEVDLEAKVWTIPAARMKAGKAHRVPLTDAALTVLGKPGAPGAVIFPGAKGQPMSDMTISKAMRQIRADAVPHGLRSTLRDWCAEQAVPRELAESLLAHTVGGVEGAYFRSDVIDQRRAVLERWANYVTGKGQ